MVSSFLPVNFKVVASLARGVPLVLTSAAAAGAPGDPFAQGDDGAVPSALFFAEQACARTVFVLHL
jgi:hypothetical protein